MKRILILCTGNSCRSQMAMAYLQSLGTDIEVYSAGTCPAFTGNVTERLHLGFDDPAAATGSHQEIMDVFRRVRDEIKNVFARFYISEIQKKPLPQCCCGK